MEIFKDSKIIWRYLRKYKRKVYFIALIALMGSFVSAVIPYIYGRLVDIAVEESSSFQLIGGILLGWLILSLLGNWLGRIARNRGNRVSIDVEMDFRLKITNHLLFLPLSFHKNENMGEIIQRANRGAGFLDTIISQVVFHLGPDLLLMVSSVLLNKYSTDFRYCLKTFEIFLLL